MSIFSNYKKLTISPLQIVFFAIIAAVFAEEMKMDDEMKNDEPIEMPEPAKFPPGVDEKLCPGI